MFYYTSKGAKLNRDKTTGPMMSTWAKLYLVTWDTKCCKKKEIQCSQVTLINSLYLELELHARDVLPTLYLGQFLDVGIEVSGGHFGGAAVDGFLERVVYKDILVFCLHHVVALGTHYCYMSVDIHSLFMLDTLQHGIDHNEATCAPNPSTAVEDGKCVKKRQV